MTLKQAERYIDEAAARTHERPDGDAIGSTLGLTSMLRAAGYRATAVVGGRLFMGSQSGAVYALDAETGCTYWVFEAETWVRTAISVGPYSGGYAVYFADAGNTYDLRWNSVQGGIIDDNYEENDDYLSAHDLSSFEGLWLSSIDGHGIQADDDWYEISIVPGYENVIIILNFTHSISNIDLGLYDNNGNLIISNASTTDNEYLNYIVSLSGVYYIEVYGNNTGNIYDFTWETKEVLPSETIPGYDLLFFLSSILIIALLLFIKWKRIKF